MHETNLRPGWAIYLRVSDKDKQKPDRSFAMQRQYAREQLIRPSGLPVYHEYEDILTGTTSKRVDYQRMLSDAEAGRFSHLALYRADRFGRDSVEGAQAARMLIDLGIKIRDAHMPFVEPETADGWLIFQLFMSLAQHEVDVMRKRANDGRKAKILSGGWAAKAPEGYVNKERLISSGKYHRWIESDPDVAPALRLAWELLLTDRYTLDQICEELAARSFTRSKGRPWAWTDPKTGNRKTAKNRLHAIFHKPLYAGWAVSKRFGVLYGEVKGEWDPIVTSDMFERGIAILRKHDRQKQRVRRQFYLLRSLLWVKVDGKLYQMGGSTPRGRSRTYSYYVARSKPRGTLLHIPCDAVDGRIAEWLRGITVDPKLLPAIREAYEIELAQANQSDRATEIEELERRLAHLHQAEARLARIHTEGKLTNDNYDLLWAEWLEKKRNTEARIADIERDISWRLDELDSALLLLASIHELFGRLERNQQASLLQIIAKRIIVSTDGEIIEYELNSPFAYLSELTQELQTSRKKGQGSTQVRPSPPYIAIPKSAQVARADCAM